MTTDRLYRTDSYKKTNTAEVIAITEKDGMDCIVCSESVFFPEGGGQPSDIGTVSIGDRVFSVTRASDKSLETEVWHHTDAPAGTFGLGDKVTLTIDWDHRFRNMQRHCGEHMLSGTFHQLWGGVNKGFHMGEDYITVDIDMDGRMFTEEEIDLAEKTCNEAIWMDLPVHVELFGNYEASLARPVRKQVPHEGAVSVVTVGDIEDPYDCIACCGTHPSSSGQVGLITIYKVEPNKGMNRVYFDCGSMAQAKLSADMKLLGEVAARNSCSPQKLMQKMDSDAENTAKLKAQVSRMASYIKASEAESIKAAFTDSVLIYSLDIIPVDELLKLGFSVIGETENKLLILLHQDAKTALLLSSGDTRCGALVKELAGEFNGRGGGRDDNARAIFGSVAEMKAFAEKVSEVVK